MLSNVDLEENAIWKQSFRTQSILWVRIAIRNLQRGVICTDLSGVQQHYAWNVGIGDHKQLIGRPTGVVNGLISVDGEYIYYLHDNG